MPLITAEELGADYEDKVAPEGKYDVRIQKASYGPTSGKEGKVIRNMVTVMLTIDGNEGDGVAPFNEYLVLPNDHGETDKTKRLFMQRITRFLEVFGVPVGSDGFDPETAPEVFPGLTATCSVEQDEGNDGVIRNRLKLPKINR